MGYRVDYQPVKKVRGVQKRVTAGGALVCVVLLLLVAILWPGQVESLREALTPGDPAVTAAAFAEFAGELKAGTPLGQALESFCQQVLEGAGFAAD